MNVSRLQAPGVREAEALMHLVADQIAQLPWERPHEVTGRVDRSMKLELKASKSTLPDVNHREDEARQLLAALPSEEQRIVRMRSKRNPSSENPIRW
jgi:hypothetical protein